MVLRNYDVADFLLSVAGHMTLELIQNLEKKLRTLTHIYTLEILNLEKLCI